MPPDSKKKKKASMPPKIVLDSNQEEHLDLAKKLRKVVDGDASHDDFYPQDDPYSSPPKDLVRRLARDQDPDLDDEKHKVQIFFTTARRLKSAAEAQAEAEAEAEATGAPRKKKAVAVPDGKSPRRPRAVQGGGGDTYWRPETGKMHILDGKELLAYSCRLAYVRRAKRNTLGWIMVEIMLPELMWEDQMLILCKLYRSPRAKDTGASTSAPIPRPLAATVPLSRDTSPLEHKPEELSIVEVKPDLLDSKPQSSKGEGILGRSGWFITKTKQPPPLAAVVMMLGDSSSMNTSTERIKEMARQMIKFSAVSESPVVVVSALENTRTNLLQVAALKASRDGSRSKINQLQEITEELHLRTVEELGLDSSIVSGLLDELGCELHAIPTMEKLNDKTRAYLASFGEQICATIFAAYLNHLGEEAGEWKLQTVNICGSGGTDLIATTIAKELGSTEIQVWNDTHGVMTCHPPTICGMATRQPYLTFEEAAEIMFSDRRPMQLASECCISIKVKNLYEPEAPGTVITKTRDMSKNMLTSIVLKSNIIMLDIKRKMVPAQSNFVARCYSMFESERIIVDCVASSGDGMSVIVASSKESTRGLVNMEVGTLVEKLGNFADVNPLERSIISLVGNAQESPRILEKTFQTLAIMGVKVQMMGQHSAKEDEQVTNVSFLVKESEAKISVQALHSAFFPFESPDPVNSSASASSSVGIERYSSKRMERSGIGGPSPFSVKKPEQTTEPVRSAQDVGRKSDGVMDIGAAEAQPEVPVDVTTHMGNSIHDMSSRVLREVGDGNSNVKEANEGALKKIEHPMFSGGRFSMNANNDSQRFSWGNGIKYPQGTAYSLGLGRQLLAPYPPPAAGHPNAHESPGILAKASSARETIDGNVQMLGQLPAMEDEHVMTTSFVVKESEAERSVRTLHSELNPVNSSLAASSTGEKRKVDDDHPEAPPSARQMQMMGTAPSAVRERTDGSALVETEVTTFSVKPRDPITEPIRSDMEDLVYEDLPEQLPGFPVDYSSVGFLTDPPIHSSFAGLPTGLPLDYFTRVPCEVGESSNGAHNVLDRTDDVMNNKHRVLSGDPIWMPANNDSQNLSGFEYPPGTPYSLGVGQHTLAPYPPSAAGDTNAQKFPGILAKGQASSAQETIDGNIQMLEQLLAAKEDEQVKTVSFYVKDSKAECSIRAVQSESFELNRGNSFVAASSSGQKRKMDEDHPEDPPIMRQLQVAGTDPSVVQERTDGSDLEETERTAFSGMDTDQAMLYNIPDKNTIEPVGSAMDDDEWLNCLIESPPVAQPEHTFGSGMDFSSGDFGTHPDVGEGCSGTPNVLDDTEHSCHSVKEADHNSLKKIEYMKLHDNLSRMPANCQRYGGVDDSADPLGVGHHNSAQYPQLATGYHTSAGVDNSPGTAGDDNGEYPPPDGNYSPLFNEDECKNLDGENNYICNKEDWPIL